MHGVYTGSDYPHLRGKGALLQNLPKTKCFLVQFDDRSLTLSGKIFPWWDQNSEPDPGDPPLGFGWVPFARSDFSVDAEPVAEISPRP